MLKLYVGFNQEEYITFLGSGFGPSPLASTPKAGFSVQRFSGSEFKQFVLLGLDIIQPI
jgi:hypothetical protein